MFRMFLLWILLLLQLLKERIALGLFVVAWAAVVESSPPPPWFVRPRLIGLHGRLSKATTTTSERA